jgi:enoyl-CoA hydratase/carnithine racemase
MIHKDFALDIDSPIATITINRPSQLNAITSEMWQQIPQIATELQSNDSVRVVIFQGAGTKAFSAGADINDFDTTRSTPQLAQKYRQNVDEACDAISSLTKPTVAAIEGYCLGGGFELALCMDIRVSSDTAKFGLPAAKRGIAISHHHLEKLIQVVGHNEANYLLLTGRSIDANRALSLGLVSTITEHGKLYDATAALAIEIAELSPVSHRFHKQALSDLKRYGGVRGIPKDSLQAIDATEASNDFIEGVTSFKEKRDAHFPGN